MTVRAHSLTTLEVMGSRASMCCRMCA